MLIDFSPVDKSQIKLGEFARRFTLDDLRAATNASIDAILAIVNSLTDEQIAFIPNDPIAIISCQRVVETVYVGQ